MNCVLVDVGVNGGVAVQPAFPVSSANSKPFVFGGNVQSSTGGSSLWNVQVALCISV